MNPVLGFSLLHIAVVGGFIFNLAMRDNTFLASIGWIALIAGQLVLLWAYLAEVKRRRKFEKAITKASSAIDAPPRPDSKIKPASKS